MTALRHAVPHAETPMADRRQATASGRDSARNERVKALANGIKKSSQFGTDAAREDFVAKRSK